MGRLTMTILGLLALLITLLIAYAALAVASDYDDRTEEEIDKFMHGREEKEDDSNSGM